MRRELLLAARSDGVWAVHLEDGRPVELEIEPPGDVPRPESIHLGIVRRVMPGLAAVFVDVGTGRDVLVQDADLTGPSPASAPANPGTVRAHQRGSLREGEKVVVQIRRAPRPGKGATGTLEPALAGRRLVYLPTTGRMTVSRRIEDPAERERLSVLLRRRLTSGAGAIVRTAAAGEPEERMDSELEELRARWEATVAEAASGAAGGAAPRRLDPGPDLPERLIRDQDLGAMERIIVDGPGLYERLTELVARAGLRSAPRIEGHAPDGTLLENRGVRDGLEVALRRIVALPSGGRIIIDTTEALVAVDVDTGSNAASADFEATAGETNREAALEIMRQLRLRNLAGLIVVDFIDQSTAAGRRERERTLGDAIAGDRGRTRLTGTSASGLVEMVRRRRGPSIGEVLAARCDTCGGTGHVRLDRRRAARTGGPGGPGIE